MTNTLSAKVKPRLVDNLPVPGEEADPQASSVLIVPQIPQGVLECAFSIAVNRLLKMQSQVLPLSITVHISKILLVYCQRPDGAEPTLLHLLS